MQDVSSFVDGSVGGFVSDSEAEEEGSKVRVNISLFPCNVNAVMFTNLGSIMSRFCFQIGLLDEVTQGRNSVR